MGGINLNKKRKSLKQIFLTRVIATVVCIILIVTAISSGQQADHINDLTETLLGRESINYSYEIYNWWSLIKGKVEQTARIYKSMPEQSRDTVKQLLLKLTSGDSDFQDIYIGYGSDGTFLDGSGWIPSSDFVFTDRTWYKGAINANGGIFTSDPYLDASTGKTCLACSMMLDTNVVLSSDITFDKLDSRIHNFKSSYSETGFYLVNINTLDIMLSTDENVVGSTLDNCTDPIIQGLANVFGELNKTSASAENKVKTVKTPEGVKMMYAATLVEATSWVVVSATPYNVVLNSILSSMYLNIGAALVLLALASVLLNFIIRKYLNPVTKVSGKIGDLSDGDFTTEIKPQGNNEITTLSEKMNEYISRMREMLINLSGITEDMHASAEECSGISLGLSDSGNSQNKSIEQLNDYLNGLNSSIAKVANGATELAGVSSKLAENSNQAKELCLETVHSSDEGRTELRGMTESFSTLNATIKELTALIRTTAETVDQIKGITVTIEDISSQTNLLSLNASIEAARAGEAGRGFAVVAGEVGALANQSTDAATHISELVEAITQNIEQINRKADDCMRDMERCTAGVEHSNSSFESIYTDITRATEAIGEIADGVERINGVAANNADATEKQAKTVNRILDLSGMIVNDSDKISAETVKLSDVSAKLNGYSSDIMDDLKNFTLK